MDAPTVNELLADPIVRTALDAAWADSFVFDPVLRHEEGGWIYIEPATGRIDVRRALPGMRDGLILDPPVVLTGWFIVGTFHTHPNPSDQGWTAEPSPADHVMMAQCGVPGIIVSDVGIFICGPTRRHGGLTGNPGYPD